MIDDNRKILYIDDEKPNLTNFKFLFQDKYEIYTALSAKEGMELLMTNEFQIVVSDQRMPDMTGITFLSEVAQKYPYTVRILLTAYTETQDIIDAINIGQVYQYITKPYKRATVDNVLKKAFELWNLRWQNSILIEELKKKNQESEQLNEELRHSIEELQMAKEVAVNSERKTKELFDELLIAKEKAEEGDRLKTAFLQNISHEIRTPLNAICGFSDLLDSTDINLNLSPEKIKDFTSVIKNSSKQLLSIVSNILTIASLDTKQEKIENEEVCINHVITELMSIFKIQTSRKGINLSSKQSLSHQQSTIYSDRTKLNQILSNLLVNALKFTHRGFIEFGYELISLERDELSELKFFVKDSGIGIAANHQKHIFERFRQADPSITEEFGGTGLGLSISKGFVELLGGKIWLESEPDKGSTFYFTIPYKPAFIEPKMIHDSIMEIKPTSVLVVEDEEYNYQFIEQLLLKLNLSPILAKDGQEAIDICKENQSIGLILMDIRMPILDGFSAAKQIKKVRPDLPIVAQTAYTLNNERLKYYGDTFDDYIIKPIDIYIFNQIVVKHIGDTKD